MDAILFYVHLVGRIVKIVGTVERVVFVKISNTDAMITNYFNQLFLATIFLSGEWKWYPKLSFCLSNISRGIYTSSGIIEEKFG